MEYDKIILVLKMDLSYYMLGALGNAAKPTGLKAVQSMEEHIMSSRAIGIFDSGLGGLTVARELEMLLPRESLIYFGDTGRAPYGGRSKETLIRFGRQNIEFLMGFDVKLIVAACGTISAVGLPRLKQEYDIPLFGIIDSGARAAALATSNGRIGIIATQASISSGAYQSAVGEIDRQLYIKAQACPRFVTLAEAGRFKPSDPEVMEAVREYLEPVKKEGVDTLLLGCTHYPIMEQAIRQYMGDDVTLVSAGSAAALELVQYLSEKKLCVQDDAPVQPRYYTSGSSEAFVKTAELFFGTGLKVSAVAPFSYGDS